MRIDDYNNLSQFKLVSCKFPLAGPEIRPPFQFDKTMSQQNLTAKELTNY